MNLLKFFQKKEERRIIPRFPFSRMIFKGGNFSAMEVVNISYHGMQLKGDVTPFKVKDHLVGQLSWYQHGVTLQGVIKWINGQNIGMQFASSSKKEVENLLTIENIIEGMRPLHGMKIEEGMPSSLRYWLRSDGPYELLVWQNPAGAFTSFQIIMLDSFVEWVDGVGIRSGKIISNRELDTPLCAQRESTFQIDRTVDLNNLSLARKLLDAMPFIESDHHQFFKMKLSS